MDTLYTDLTTNGTPAADHAPIPSSGSRARMKPNVLIAKFGRGYEQRTGDGPINTNLRDWSLVWNNIPKVHVDALDTFFADKAGKEKFLWTQLRPRDTEGPKAFICEEWEWQYVGGDCHNFQAMFLQRPAV